MPGDFSSAAPFIVAARLVPESRITIHGVNLNPRRTGLLDVLDRMGARVGILERAAHRLRAGGRRSRCGAAELTATTIKSDEVPLLVDELPLFGLLASGARGESWVYGAGELRLKETDRIDALVDALRAIGGARQGRMRTASRSPASRPARAAAESSRAATTGSPCSGPLQGSGRAKGYASRAPRAWRYPSPASTSSSTESAQR